jgi:hypothetical protein
MYVRTYVRILSTFDNYALYTYVNHLIAIKGLDREGFDSEISSSVRNGGVTLSPSGSLEKKP